MIRNEKTDMSDTARIRAFIDRALEAEKIRHPLRSTGRLLNVVSFGRFGIPSGGGWKRLDAKDSGTDTKLLMDVLWRTFWTALPDIAVYENGLELPDELEEEDEYIEPPQLESGVPEYVPHILMLPPPSGPEFIPTVDAEIVQPEPLREIDEAELAWEAETAADNALSFFKGDHPRWEDPHELIEDIESILVSIVPHHPDTESLFERIAFVRSCYGHLNEFYAVFNSLMNGTNTPDSSWNAPWLACASQDLQSQGLMPTPDNLCRASIPHFLTLRWVSAIEKMDSSEAATDGDRVESAELSPPVAENNSTKPFRPALDTESGF